MKKTLLQIPYVRAKVTNKNLHNAEYFEKEVFEIFKRFESFTMCQEYKYIRNLSLVSKFKHIEGSVVECGTWKGGMVAGIASLLENQNRDYFLFDSFEGLPDAKEIDGQAAIDWQNNVDSDAYLDNCTASEADAVAAMKKSKAKSYTINKGWFENTLPKADLKESIAILRLDGDWYDSTMTCLNELFPKVAKGGIIILDDYYTWDGCTKAVHDYLSSNKLSNPIYQHMNSIAYIIK